jgi:hypothetical protein
MAAQLHASRTQASKNLQGVVSHDKADAEAILRRPASRMMD